MNFRIADTFTGSQAHLAGDEQKVATTAFDPQLNLERRSMTVHESGHVCTGDRVINHLGDMGTTVFEAA